MYQIMYQIKKQLQFLYRNCLIFSDPAGIRTLDPMIKSQLLYQLSYAPAAAYGPKTVTVRGRRYSKQMPGCEVCLLRSPCTAAPHMLIAA